MNIKTFNKLVSLSRDMIHLPQNRSKHFSFILYKKNIISFGWNKVFKTHPLSKKYGYWNEAIHSELDAINNFPYHHSQLSNYTLVNIRLYLDGKIALSKPCKTCSKLIKAFNIRNVYFSTQEGFQFIDYRLA